MQQPSRFFQIPEPPLGFGARFLRRQPFPPQLLDSQGEVQRDLIVGVSARAVGLSDGQSEQARDAWANAVALIGSHRSAPARR